MVSFTFISSECVVNITAAPDKTDVPVVFLLSKLLSVRVGSKEL